MPKEQKVPLPNQKRSLLPRPLPKVVVRDRGKSQTIPGSAGRMQHSDDDKVNFKGVVSFLQEMDSRTMHELLDVLFDLAKRVRKRLNWIFSKLLSRKHIEKTKIEGQLEEFIHVDVVKRWRNLVDA